MCGTPAPNGACVWELKITQISVTFVLEHKVYGIKKNLLRSGTEFSHEPARRARTEQIINLRIIHVSVNKT